MQKKEYKAPKLKEVKLNARASLLQNSDYHGTISYNADAVENPKV